MHFENYFLNKFFKVKTLPLNDLLVLCILRVLSLLFTDPINLFDKTTRSIPCF